MGSLQVYANARFGERSIIIPSVSKHKVLAINIWRNLVCVVQLHGYETSRVHMAPIRILVFHTCDMVFVTWRYVTNQKAHEFDLMRCHVAWFHQLEV